MPHKLAVRCRSHASFVIYRTAFRDEKLVYVIRASKKIKYPWGQSRIGYIGTTKKGARRIASSAVSKGEDLLYLFGIKHLEIHIVTCGKIKGVETRKKLERALLLRFKERFGGLPRANTAGKKGHFKDEKEYFSYDKLDKVIDRLS